MIPILMQDETTVGFLKEAMSCVVTVGVEHVSCALSSFPVEEIHITGTATRFGRLRRYAPAKAAGTRKS